MKRFIFSAIALMMAATACTESGLIDAPEFYGNAIVFDTYIGKTPMTKAENIDVDYLKGGAVAGAKLYAFTSKQLETPSRDYVDYDSPHLDGRLMWSNQAWGYQALKNGSWSAEEPYMPTGKDLAVVAYNLKADSCIDQDTRTSTEFDFTVNETVSEQVDLLVTPLTFVRENTNGDTSVPLRFYHLLSRIGFKVSANNPSDSEIVFESIEICGKFSTAGHVDMTLAMATPSTSTETIQLLGTRPVIQPSGNDYLDNFSLLGGKNFTTNAKDCYDAPNPIYPDGGSADNRFMMIIPGQVGDLTGEVTTPHIKVKYSLGGGDTRTSTVWLTDNNEKDGENMTFEAGKAYEFILTLSTATIDFSASVVEGGWDTDLNDNDTDDDEIPMT